MLVFSISKHITYSGEDLARSLAGILLGPDVPVSVDLDGDKWNIGNGNNFWLRPLSPLDKTVGALPLQLTDDYDYFWLESRHRLPGRLQHAIAWILVWRYATTRTVHVFTVAGLAGTSLAREVTKEDLS